MNKGAIVLTILMGAAAFTISYWLVEWYASRVNVISSDAYWIGWILW